MDTGGRPWRSLLKDLFENVRFLRRISQEDRLEDAADAIDQYKISERERQPDDPRQCIST
jgi:hypothetical protein